MNLGPYAGFIVPAYAASAIAVIWMVIDTLIRARAWRRKVDALETKTDKTP